MISKSKKVGARQNRLVIKSKLLLGALTLTAALSVSATVVEVRTVEGNFQVNLFDETAPKTVANFLTYVNSGQYANSIFHRKVDGFVVQGGGFTYVGPNDLDDVVVGPSVINEPAISNRRGTLAMAKGTDPNSARAQWFVNVNNNSANLDVQGQGFTVFGQVLGDGMDVVDAIAALPTFNFGGALAELPLRNYTTADLSAEEPLTDTHFVIINDIVITDDAVVTNPQLDPPKISTAPPPTNPTPDPDAGGSSGGSAGWLIIGVLGLTLFRRLGRR